MEALTAAAQAYLDAFLRFGGPVVGVVAAGMTLVTFLFGGELLERWPQGPVPSLRG